MFPVHGTAYNDLCRKKRVTEPPRFKELLRHPLSEFCHCIRRKSPLMVSGSIPRHVSSPASFTEKEPTSSQI